MPLDAQSLTQSLLATVQVEEADTEYAVRKRGRPERDRAKQDAAKARTAAFGAYLRRLRTEAGLTISEAARSAGLSSGKLLSAYEGTCYPPGETVLVLAELYGVPPRELALAVLRFSNPHLFGVLFPDLVEEGSDDAS